MIANHEPVHPVQSLLVLLVFAVVVGMAGGATAFFLLMRFWGRQKAEAIADRAVEVQRRIVTGELDDDGMRTEKTR